MADLVRRNIYDGDVMELERDVFDSLFIQEQEGSKEVFAALRAKALCMWPTMVMQIRL